MKTKFGKLLHLLGLDVLLLGLFEKLALGLSKKFAQWRESLQNSLIRVEQYRNEYLKATGNCGHCKTHCDDCEN